MSVLNVISLRMMNMDSVESCELQHCRLRTDILCEVQRREEKQDERFLALIEDIERKFDRGEKRCMLQMPTGAGKTFVFCELAKRYFLTVFKSVKSCTESCT